MKKETIIVGRIYGVHGIKGQVKVECISDNPARFQKGTRLFLEKTQQYVTILQSEPYKGGLLLSFEELPDRNDAEKACPSYLLVDKTDLPVLPEGSYYHFQLIGMAVCQKEILLGKIIAIDSRGGTDYYVVEQENGKTFMIPAIKEFIHEIDVENQKMMVQLPQGLME